VIPVVINKYVRKGGTRSRLVVAALVIRVIKSECD